MAQSIKFDNNTFLDLSGVSYANAAVTNPVNRKDELTFNKCTPYSTWAYMSLYKIGKLAIISVTLKATEAMSANTRYNIVYLPDDFRCSTGWLLGGYVENYTPPNLIYIPSGDGDTIRISSSVNIPINGIFEIFGVFITDN